MRSIPISMATLRVLVVVWTVPLIAQQGPCAQITTACKNAGFTLGSASTGTGLETECVMPIMQGVAQPAAARRPLPQIDPKVVAACKASHPDFGQKKGPSPAVTNGNGMTPSTSGVTAGAGSLQPGVPSGQVGQADVERAPKTPSPSTVTKLNGEIRNWLLTCRIGQMNSGYFYGGGSGDVAFLASTGPASGVQAGQCAFDDRAVKPSEPHALCVDASLSEVKLDSGGVKIISFTGAGAALLNSVANGPTKLMKFTVHLNAPANAGCWIIDKYGP